MANTKYFLIVNILRRNLKQMFSLFIICKYDSFLKMQSTNINQNQVNLVNLMCIYLYLIMSSAHTVLTGRVHRNDMTLFFDISMSRGKTLGASPRQTSKAAIQFSRKRRAVRLCANIRSGLSCEVL